MSTTNITPTELIIQYPCLWDNCRDSFLSLPDLGAHIATVHLNTLSSFNCKWRTCHNYNFQTKYSLVQHIYSHLSSIPNHLQTREMVRITPYYPHYYYNQVPSGIYPQTYIQSPYRPYTYQYTPIIQNFQSRSGQNSLRSVDPQSVVLRQYKIPQQIDLVTPSQIVIQEKVVPSQIINIQDESPIQCFSHSNASSTSTQKQEQINTTDLKKELEELRDLLKEQTQKLNDKTQELDKNTEEMKKMADEIDEKSREITKLKSTISLKDSEMSIIKENLELQTSISKILQEQNRIADDKLRRMWVEMLCRKADLGESVSNRKMNINDEPSSFTSRKRPRRDKDEETENSDLHPMELPAPPHENISVITKGISCSWDGCEKTFRTRLALKAHIVSSHMNEEILKVPVINP
ncbi:hypothetical protein GLOIN_2v1653790 [Rhizophagus irregularis DAOM 181602=DAOM 197198]|uniref:C2H2-type domain-containing protein n=1 Tax=Rhizophagus irregularis (strain DAOM 181602 / DAOM 197198 / MUCL 43194) TaxID=747089 RepID=A0A2P4PN76_RHIID|nr:hypothetical protein GLOIN_2v1653790 [Rhizophagus irregularis DAOM 181602=DAOM 197198]POG66809.1 hypothetical protein GLOIN_2v1653790 [Rhizophagus irregularis DAOM 181602=DAOM 197198]|eukprot:XP_025173675.1 hypothetical protein GLOIN_2v1653790 [Rhizophagus irregularis DAOM 181602=DAOM 197198]